MRLIIVRHGQTDFNILGLLQGHGGSGLNAQGFKEATKVAERLRQENITTAYVSDLARTTETAAEILKYHPHCKIIFTSKLRERNHGIFEGKTAEEMTGAREKLQIEFEHFKPEGGESHVEVQERIQKLYHQLISKHVHETVLLVSHGGTIRALLLLIFKESFSIDNYPKYHLGNCALTILEISETKKPTIEVLNCIKHLEK